MRLRLSAEEVRRLERAWPQVCCGCGAPPTTTWPAFLRRAAGTGGGDWVTLTLRLPACAPCARRGRWLPVAWAALCVLLFAGGLLAAKAGVRFEADGSPVEGATRALRLTLLLGVPAAVISGPPVFLILQRRAAPALIAATDAPSMAGAAWVDLECGEAFAAAVHRSGLGAG